MKFIMEEKDEGYINNVNEYLSNPEEYLPILIHKVGSEYYLNFTCTDVAKANNFILTLLSPNNREYIEETLGVNINSLNYCHGDNKLHELKAYLQNFINAIDNIH